VSERGGRLRARLGQLFGEPETSDAALDMPRAQKNGGVFWLIGGVCLAALFPFAPPTRQLGWPGWPIAALALLGCGVVVRRRFDQTRSASLNEIFLSGCLGLAGIAAFEWLAGGRSTPYHELYVLPAIYAAAIHRPRRGLIFLGAVVLAACMPLTYTTLTKDQVVDLAAQLAMLAALAMVARVLIVTVRTQRAELRRAEGEAKRARDEAEGRARRDPLTGLGNRLAFQEAIVREVARVSRSGGLLSLLLGDIHNFKRINDTLGHLRGDECLRSAAEAIAGAIRAVDQCFRWGGDEFVVLLPETAPGEAERVCERLSAAVSSECGEPGGERLELTFAATSLGEGQGPGDLMAAADELLIALKTHSRSPAPPAANAH